MTAGGERPDFAAMAEHGDAVAQTYIAAAEKAWRDGNQLHMRRMLREAGINLEWAAVQREQDILHPPGQVIDAAEVPTDEQVEHLSATMEQADAEVRRLTALYEAADRKAERLNRIYPAYSPQVRAADAETERINAEVDQAEAVATQLNDQYNAACAAQYADSDRRRDINVVRYGRDQNADRGNLADALLGDDWLEDHAGMHADERRTCHQCQSWADHAHDQITNRRITLEQWEGRTPAVGRCDDCEGVGYRGYGDPCPACDGRGWFEDATGESLAMPPAAEPWTRPVEVCGICDQPESDHPARSWAPGGAADDGHHYCPKGRRCPTCQTSASPDAASPPTAQGATMRVPGQSTATTIADRYDQFWTWLFGKWAGDYQVSTRPDAPHRIAARVDAKIAEQKTGQTAPQQAEDPPQADTRPQPQPQDLDAIASAPPPRTSTKFRPPPPKPRLNAWSNVDRDWCSCEGNAHDARCRFANGRRLDVSGHFSPPPGGGASPEPAPTNQP